MKRTTGGTKWTKEDTNFLISYWRTKKLLGFSDKDIADQLTTKLIRSRDSILGKAVMLKLTKSTARLAHEYSQSSLAQ